MTGAEILSAEQKLLTTYDQAIQQKIAARAYQKAEKRGFAPGHELEDWLAAEAELEAEEALVHLEPED